MGGSGTPPPRTVIGEPSRACGQDRNRQVLVELIVCQCAGRRTTPLYGEIFVKGVPQGSYPLSRPSVSLFDLAAVSSSRPTPRVAGARRSGQGWPPSGGHRQAWPCTAPSTPAHWPRSG